MNGGDARRVGGRMAMEIACYHTLSTISQTLAGAFGLLLAVVVYRRRAD